MILSDREIDAALRLGHIVIDKKPDSELWTSTAVDLTLDEGLLEWLEPAPTAAGQPGNVSPFDAGFNITAMTFDDKYARRFPIPDGGFILRPGKFILGYTQQKVYLPNESRIAARVEGKSSLARLGIGVHVTAPTIHAGFGYTANKEGKSGLPIQLEIFNLGNLNVVLKTGMPICQLILEEVREVPSKGYGGQFSEQTKFTEKVE